MIPEQRLCISLHAPQRFGKSTLAGLIVEEALRTGQFKKAYLYVHSKKIDETLPKYPSEVEIPKTSLTMRWIQNYRNCIIVAEDAMRWGKHRCPLCRKKVKPTITKYIESPEVIFRASGYPALPIFSVRYVCEDCQMTFEKYWCVEKTWRASQEWRKDWNEAMKVLSESEVD